MAGKMLLHVTQEVIVFEKNTRDGGSDSVSVPFMSTFISMSL